jgi:hypothetical protein
LILFWSKHKQFVGFCYAQMMGKTSLNAHIKQHLGVVVGQSVVDLGSAVFSCKNEPLASVLVAEV